MNEKALNVLEYEKIIALLKEQGRLRYDPQGHIGTATVYGYTGNFRGTKVNHGSG